MTAILSYTIVKLPQIYILALEHFYFHILRQWPTSSMSYSFQIFNCFISNLMEAFPVSLIISFSPTFYISAFNFNGIFLRMMKRMGTAYWITLPGHRWQFHCFSDSHLVISHPWDSTRLIWHSLIQWSSCLLQENFWKSFISAVFRQSWQNIAQCVVWMTTCWSFLHGMIWILSKLVLGYLNNFLPLVWVHITTCDYGSLVDEFLDLVGMCIKVLT